jgi:hypothetical protein
LNLKDTNKLQYEPRFWHLNTQQRRPFFFSFLSPHNSFIVSPAHPSNPVHQVQKVQSTSPCQHRHSLAHADHENHEAKAASASHQQKQKAQQQPDADYHQPQKPGSPEHAYPSRSDDSP